VKLKRICFWTRAAGGGPSGQGRHLPVFWTSNQFPPAEPSCKLNESQSKVRLWGEFTAWMQSNWYALGNLLFQFAFLAATVWFAREILRTMRASQEQVGALLKLSITGATTERHSPIAVAERALAGASSSGASSYLAYADGDTSRWPAGAPRNDLGRWAVARHSLVVWLQTTHEQWRRRPLAQSNQVAAGPSKVILRPDRTTT